jgi:hypothetical protein
MGNICPLDLWGEKWVTTKLWKIMSVADDGWASEIRNQTVRAWWFIRMGLPKTMTGSSTYVMDGRP